MLEEFHGVMQERGAPTHRRWFQDGGMELIVWYREQGQPEGFQLCYRGPDLQERALTWRGAQGFSHARVDSGDTRPDKNLTPILVRDGAVPWAWVQGEFTQRAGQLEPAVRDLVLAALASPDR